MVGAGGGVGLVLGTGAASASGAAAAGTLRMLLTRSVSRDTGWMDGWMEQIKKRSETARRETKRAEGMKKSDFLFFAFHLICIINIFVATVQYQI